MRPNKACLNYDRHTILSVIWPATKHHNPPNVYVILDGVRDKNVEPLISKSHVQSACLYSGKLTSETRRSAPYLIKIEQNNTDSHPFLDFALRDGIGIVYIAQSELTLQQLRDHCRRISKVVLPNKKTVNFRFYDPRVLPLIFKVSKESERTKILGPASSIIMFEHNYYYVASRVNDTFVDMHKDVTLKLPTNELTYHVNYGAGLTFRQEHIDVFAQKNDNTFFNTTFMSFLRIYEPDIEKDYFIGKTPVSLKSYLKPCFKLSQQYDLKDGYSVTYFFHLYVELGHDFLANQQYSWIQDILNQNRPAEARIEQIERKMTKQLMEKLW